MSQEHRHERSEAPEDQAPEAQGAPAPPPEDVGGKALADALRLSFAFLKLAMVALIGLYLAQGFFTVGRDEVRIKLRFGRPVLVSRGKGRGKGYVIDSESGWHYCWPWEELVSVPLSEQVLNVEKDFWYGWMDEAAKFAREQPGREVGGYNVKTDGYLITGDANIIHLKLRVRYTARDDEQGALDYAFRVRSPEELLRRFVVESTVETVASWDVLDVHRKLKEYPAAEGSPARLVDLYGEIRRRTERKLEEFEQANGFSPGIRLTAIEGITDPEVPDQVKAAFDEAQQARSEKERLIDDGRRVATSILKTAEGRASEILEEARAYKNRLIAMAHADAKAIENLRQAYAVPSLAAILREWHYERMAEELLGQGEGSIVLHAPDDDAHMQVRLLISGAPKKAPPQEEAAGSEQAGQSE